MLPFIKHERRKTATQTTGLIVPLGNTITKTIGADEISISNAGSIQSLTQSQSSCHAIKGSIISLFM